MFLKTMAGVAVFLTLGACATSGLMSGATGPSRYLAVWTGDDDLKDSDFLAVLDVEPRSPQYGRVVTTVPIGMNALQPHHTEHFLDPSGILFASGWAGDRTFRFDLRQPERPRLLGEVLRPKDIHFLHSFVRLPNGHVLATYQAEGEKREGAGGLAEFDAEGRFVRKSSARWPGIDPEALRPYSLAVLPNLDRIVTACNAMPFPTTWTDPRVVALREHRDHGPRGLHVQVWRLSDLQLLATLPLPTEPRDRRAVGPTEPRVLADKRTVLIPTGQGALFKVDQLDTTPTVTRVYTFETSPPATGTAGPLVIGRYWIQTLGRSHLIISLDVSDPAHPKEVSRVKLGEKLIAHWVAFDEGGNRIVVADSGGGVGGENRLWMVNIDRATGKLEIDTRFRNEGSDQPGFSFDLKEWPHGATGPATPHGSVFVP